MTEPPRGERLGAAFAALFVVSGACGLVYQVVWTRQLVTVFGVTAFAVSTVLVSFMGGMALGAALLGGVADRVRRPLRMFALLEGGIGVYALLLPLLLRGADVAHRGLSGMLPDDFVVRSILRFALCLLLLLPPTALMGATLPALGRGLLQHAGRFGRGLGILYFVNTLGAAAGCWLAGFHLIPALGLFRTTLLAVAGNAAVATTAFLLERSGPGEVRAAAPAGREGAEREASCPPWWPLAVACASGAIALAFEVVWFRVLVMVFGSTVYSFSAMLTVFLLGLALGSLLFGPLADRVERPVRLLAVTTGLVALTALCGSMAVNAMPRLFLEILHAMGVDYAGMTRTKALLSVLTLLPPALAFGGTFPVAVRAYRGDSGPGRRIGRVYAWNTLGAIAGSFLTGFVLLPTVGAERTLQMIVAVGLALAFGSLVLERGPLAPRFALPAGVAVVLIAAGLVFAPRWDRRLLGAGVYFEPRQHMDAQGNLNLDRVVGDYRLVTYTEGFNETITSFRTAKGRFITVNGSPTASDHLEDMFSQRMLGHLPMALHPGPVRSACIVGLGAGVTAGAIAVHGPERLVAIELEKGVFTASRFFSAQNHGVLTDPRVKIVLDDGRNWLERTGERFDVISSAPNFPSLTGSGALYSREYFALCRRRLAAGGIMCQFAPIWRLLPQDVATIVGSFSDVFPHVRLFSTGLSLVMLGREEAFPPVDLDELRARAARPEVAASLAEIGVRGPMELLSFYQMDEAEIAALTRGADRNTDDRPRTEFRAPRGVFADTVGPNLEAIAQLRPDPEVLADRLGLVDAWRSSYLALSAAYRAVTDAEVLLTRKRAQEAMQIAVPVAESGHRYARYIVSEHALQTGLALQRQGDLGQARGFFAMALRYAPEDHDALVNLGYVDLFLGNQEEAAEVLEKAYARYPESGGAAYRLGLVRQVQGRLPEAEALYARAIALQPTLSAPHGLLGQVLLATHRPEQALARFQEAIERGDPTEGPWVGRAAALVALGRKDEAFRSAQAAVERFPRSVSALDTLAVAATASGKPEEARQAQRRREAMALQPPSR
ncbi:MAG TPA: fused MFS/spermidine synthase [Candidatus Polarisedimenticolaceae bacterium]|nr:fused MFS/spermidine synthase [Candidatus Polarisedimenticolaceae bacterium]